MSDKIARSCATHDGNFHADEITACSLLIHCDCIDADRITRTREHNLIDRAQYVVDVGGRFDPRQLRFDHHQISYTGSLSSAGMILRHLSDVGKLSADQAQMLNDNLVAGVDDHDNGRAPAHRGVCTFSHVISNFSPFEYAAGEGDLNRHFHRALDFAVGHIGRLIERQRASLDSLERVKRAMSLGKHFLLFDQPLAWIESFFALGGQNHPAKFVIMPTGSHWKLRAIPKHHEYKMDLRVPLPAAWAGRMNADLEKIAGISGAVFCHKGRFISVWKTREEAMLAGREVLRRAGYRGADQ